MHNVEVLQQPILQIAIQTVLISYKKKITEHLYDRDEDFMQELAEEIVRRFMKFNQITHSVIQEMDAR